MVLALAGGSGPRGCCFSSLGQILISTTLSPLTSLTIVSRVAGEERRHNTVSDKGLRGGDGDELRDVVLPTTIVHFPRKLFVGKGEKLLDPENGGTSGSFQGERTVRATHCTLTARCGGGAACPGIEDGVRGQASGRLARSASGER